MRRDLTYRDERFSVPAGVVRQDINLIKNGLEGRGVDFKDFQEILYRRGIGGNENFSPEVRSYAEYVFELALRKSPAERVMHVLSSPLRVLRWLDEVVFSPD